MGVPESAVVRCAEQTVDVSSKALGALAVALADILGLSAQPGLG
jgi:hypothetical protein